VVFVGLVVDEAGDSYRLVAEFFMLPKPPLREGADIELDIMSWP
jgi:hypothetical protein